MELNTIDNWLVGFLVILFLWKDIILFLYYQYLVVIASRHQYVRLIKHLYKRVLSFYDTYKLEKVIM